uniref:SLV.12 n=1 Tax=Streptomyces lavendulae TaxID=1914 RepID=Q6RGQ8_STRLA|nr:SLV.12 [Streptomyces lavendulae]
MTAAPAPAGTTGTDDAKPSGPASAPASASPSAAVDLSAPDKVAESFARQYLARNPPKDQTHRAAVGRAAPWATRSLTANLEANSDPAFDKLVSRGGVSAVSAVKVEPAGGKLPPDTPLRVWRTVTATVDVQGYTNTTETTVIQTEVTHTESGWRVSGILGV